jgi:hypothetical protein
MTYKNKQYQEIAITLLNKSVKKILFIFIGLFAFQDRTNMPRQA